MAKTVSIATTDFDGSPVHQIACANCGVLIAIVPADARPSDVSHDACPCSMPRTKISPHDVLPGDRVKPWGYSDFHEVLRVESLPGGHLKLHLDTGSKPVFGPKANPIEIAEPS